jgi:folate-binding protein YgfZ
VTTPSTDRLVGYEAALEGAAYLARTDASYLRVGGEDRVDYLQRQTTNDVHLLGPERAVLTVLTAPNARIYDVLLLVDEGEAIGVITLPGRGPATAAYFQSRIFFMDKVDVVDSSAEWAHLNVEGPLAATVLRDIGLAEAPSLDGVATFALNDVLVSVIGREGLAGTGYRLLVPVSSSEDIASALADAGAIPLDFESYEVLRLEAGLPGLGEWTEDYTPLETNLARAVSDTKGCYTGQEVIARQITYDKVTKHLVGLRLNALVSVGAQVSSEGKAVGSVTSAADSPRYGPIALAVVKREHAGGGTSLMVGDEVSAQVTPLPFAS